MSKQQQKPKPTDDLDALFACLSDSRRRRLIRILAKETTPVEFERAVQQIRERKKNTFDEDGDASQQEIPISLVHKHLPKMAEAGIVAVDFQSETLQEGPRFTTALSHLERV